MKVYGNGRKATDISARQVSVLYAKKERGELQVADWFIHDMYDLARFYGYDDNRTIERMEFDAKRVLRALFTGNDVQSVIDEIEDKWFSEKSPKAQQKIIEEVRQ